MRPPATLARVLGAYAVAPADVDDEGWYEVEPGRLYYARDADGRASYVLYDASGNTRIIHPMRAELWGALLDIGASDAECDKLSAAY